MNILPAIAMLGLWGTASPALAQFDPQLKKDCLRIEFDATAGAPILGLWYVETVYAAENQINRQYLQYDANGLFAYHDQTCSLATNMCSQNEGHGVWAANSQGEGNYYVARLFNDLLRTNWCQGWQVHVIDANTLQAPDGTLVHRVE